jgi:outer membrane protein, heavy metal efflux system
MKIILILILLVPFLNAQDRLDTFIDEAKAQNPDLMAMKNKYLAKEYLSQQQGTLPDPQFAFTQWIDPVETRVGPQQNIFSLSQKIPFPGKLGLMEDITYADAEGDKWQYNAAVLTLIYNIKLNWYDLYLTDQSLVILKDYYSLLKDFSDAAAAKYATGQGIQSQVLKAQVEHSTIKTRILELQRQRYSLQAALNHLRNRPAVDEIPALLKIDSTFSETPFDDSLQVLYEKRPEYQASLKAVQQARWQQDLAEKNWFPDLTIQANYITVADKNSMAADAGKDAWGVMLGLNLPLWFSGRNAQVEQSRKNVIMRQQQTENIKNQIQNNIADLKFKAVSTRETIDLYKNILIPQAENSFESALAAYRSGNLGFLELLDAERMLLQLRLTFLKEKVNYRKIIAAIERETGGRM